MHNSRINWVKVAVLYCYYGLTIGVKLHVLGDGVRKQFVPFSSRFIVLYRAHWCTCNKLLLKL